MSDCDPRKQYKCSQWVDLKCAADQADLHPDTMRKMAKDRRVRSRQIGGPDGPWRIWMDAEGLPGLPDAPQFEGMAA
jgi:hypothetical protein